MPIVSIRILNELGISRFKDFLITVKDKINTKIPNLNEERYSDIFLFKEKEVEIDLDIIFKTRMDLAKYLVEDVFEKHGITRDVVEGLSKEKREGLFSWFAYIWFDQLTNKRNNIGRWERYIFTDNERRYYVHLVWGAYWFYNLNLSKDLINLFLYTPVYVISDFIDHMGNYGYIISYPEIIKAAKKLYWDEEKEKPKKNATSQDVPGNLRKFTTIINQFRLTYDVFSMNCREILNILPKEFDSWKDKV